MATVLSEHRQIWEQKPVLRAIYQDYYQRLMHFILPGETLEIGGGTGNLKHYLTNVTSTDIVKTPWLDLSCDAQALPFAKNSFDTLVAMDVLHHIENPIRFFKEAERVLKPGGRIVLLEPAITKLSWFFYHFLHEEPVILNVDPLIDIPLNPDKDPFDANQAIPELIFGRYLQKFSGLFPTLSLLKKQYLSLWCYPLSGGFKKWCLIPKRFVSCILNVEKKLERHLGRIIGFRVLLVIQKANTP